MVQSSFLDPEAANWWLVDWIFLPVYRGGNIRLMEIPARKDWMEWKRSIFEDIIA